MNDLLTEFATMASTAVLSADWLSRHGIDSEVHYRAGAAIVGACRASMGGAHWFQSPETPVLVAPLSYSVETGELDPIDLLAWPLGKPSALMRRTFDGSAIGEQEISRAAFFGSPLTLHETPADWVAANGTGAVLLDWNCLPLELMEVKTFHCPNQKYASRLKRALTIPARTFEIFYPENRHENRSH